MYENQCKDILLESCGTFPFTEISIQSKIKVVMTKSGSLFGLVGVIDCFIA